MRQPAFAISVGDESAFVRKMAQGFGISEEEVGRMESWVERQLQLAREAESFWTG